MRSGLKEPIFTFVTVNLLALRDIGQQCCYQLFTILMALKERKGTHHNLLPHTGIERTSSFGSSQNRFSLSYSLFLSLYVLKQVLAQP